MSFSHSPGLLFVHGVRDFGKTVIGNADCPGIIPRVLDMLFNSIKKHQAKLKVCQSVAVVAQRVISVDR